MPTSETAATVSFEALRRMAPRWFVVCAAATFGSYALVWGLPNPFAGPLLLGLLALSGAYVAALFVHEGIHVAAMVVVGGVPRGSISFRLRLSEGIAYVHTEHAMTARAYRVVLLAPTVVLGLAPWAAGLWMGNGWIVAFAGLMLASGLGDIAVWHRLRGLPRGTLVRDHPTEAGCEIIG